MTTTLQTAGEAIEAAQVVVDRVALLVAENERLRANDVRWNHLMSRLHNRTLRVCVVDYIDSWGREDLSPLADAAKFIDAAISKATP